MTRRNAERFGVLGNVVLIRGEAPEVLLGINERFDRVFVGGGSERIEDIIRVLWGMLNGGGRVVVDAILVETVVRAVRAMEEVGFRDVEVTEVIIAKGLRTRVGTAMISRNPVFVISGEKHEALRGWPWPGDEELVTVRAVKVLGRSRVIFIPYSTGTNRSLAEGIVRRYAPGDARLVLLGFPMSRDVPDSELRRLGETICREANGEDSAFVTLGDPTLYSTFFRVRDWIPCEVEVEVIPVCPP